MLILKISFSLVPKFGVRVLSGAVSVQVEESAFCKLQIVNDGVWRRGGTPPPLYMQTRVKQAISEVFTWHSKKTGIAFENLRVCLNALYV